MKPQLETDIREVPELRYVIQFAKDATGIWWQRHVWHKTQVGEHNPPKITEWIMHGRNLMSSLLREVA